jgi:hypothetical protein
MYMQLQITKTNYDSSEIGDYLKDFEKSLLEYAATQARQNAGINKPIILDEFNAYIKNYDEISCQQKINQNQAEFLPISGMVVAKRIQEEGDKKERELLGLLHDQNHNLGQLEANKKANTPDLKKRFWAKVAVVVVSVMAIFEGVINYSALRNGSFSIWSALSIAISLTIALAFTTHIVADFIKCSDTRKQLFMRIAIVLIPAFILFFALASLRISGQNATAALSYQTGASKTPTATHTSPIAVALISFFIYALALLVSVRYAKNKKEKEQAKAYDKSCSELSIVENDISKLKKDIESVKTDTKQKVATALATWELAHIRERHIISTSQKALEVYAATNLRHRTDGICPPFFSTLPECHFITFFQSSKTD